MHRFGFKDLSLIPFLSLFLATAMACDGQDQGPEPGPSQIAQHPILVDLHGSQVVISDMERSITEAMDQARVAGLSCAILNHGQLVYANTFGVADSTSGRRPDQDTVFAAASFSKTVFAYLVMTLVEDGLLDLDTPLYTYWDQDLPEMDDYRDLSGDERWKEITSRHVLAHTTGWPNWRFFTEDGRLAFLHDPGERFGYSGEGIQLLQKTVEKITGRGLEELARGRIFEPFGMTRSSFVWQKEWEENHALPHDPWGRAKRLQRRDEAGAAGSLFTTAKDYGRFLEAIVQMARGQGERASTIKAMLSPQVQISSQRMFGPGAKRVQEGGHPLDLSWCLGWGCFGTDDKGAFFHTGHDDGWQNYTVTHLQKGIGVALLSNSDSFESVAHQIVAATIGEDRSPFTWLGYVPFDPENVQEPPPERQAIQVDAALLAQYQGVYEVKPGDRFWVRLEGPDLKCSSDGKDWEDLLAESPTHFFRRGEDLTIEFTRSESGAVDGLKVHIQGAEISVSRVGPIGEPGIFN